MHVLESPGVRAISLEFDVVVQVNGSVAKDSSKLCGGQKTTEDVAASVHFFGRKEFEGIAGGEIETEVAHCNLK